MKHLVKNAVILDTRSPFYQKKIDFILENGQVIKIGKDLPSPKDTIVITGKKLVLSTALVDIYASSGEPSDLESETLDSFIQAGTSGGFAYLAHVPNEKKLTQTKSDISFLQSKNSNSITRVLPVGNITRSDNGQTLAAMMDMHQSGAYGFSDGNEHSLGLSVLKNAMLYGKGFGAKLMIHPEKKDLSKNGQVNQGTMSVSLGYKGIAKEAEFMAVQEICQLAEYTDSSIIMLNVTCTESIESIKRANKKTKKIFTAISSLHLALDEQKLADYDTNFKLNPPLRSTRDREKMIAEAIKGSIDIVYSQHSPRTTEEKMLEFDLASFGAINLQTSFLATMNSLGIEHIEKCIELHSSNPASYMGIEFPVFKEKAKGEFTLIDLGDHFEFKLENNRSKSKNSPFFQHRFQGKIKGLIANGHVKFND